MYVTVTFLTHGDSTAGRGGGELDTRGRGGGGGSVEQKCLGEERTGED